MDENNNKKGENYFSLLKGFRRAVPIIFSAVALFIAVCFMTDSAGALGTGINALLLGLFSYGAYAIPPLLVLHALFYAEDVAKKRIISRVVFSVIAVLFVSTVEYIVAFWGKAHIFTPGAFFVSQSAGGFIGCTFGFVLTKLLGSVGVIILGVAVIAVYVTFFLARKNSAFGKVIFSLLSSFVGFLAKIERGTKKLFGKGDKPHKAKSKNELSKKSTELLDDQFFASDGKISNLKINELGINEEADDKPDVPDLRNSVFDTDTPNDAECERPSNGKKDINLHYGIRKEEEEAKAGASSSVKKESYGIDESAEAVFTSDFDPFDFVLAEKIATKASSRAAHTPRSFGITEEYARPVNLKTPEEIEREKRVLEFEMKKQRLREIHERNEEPHTVEMSYGERPIGLHKTVELSVENSPKQMAPDTSMNDSLRVTLDKSPIAEPIEDNFAKPSLGEYTTERTEESHGVSFREFSTPDEAADEEQSDNRIRIERTMLSSTPTPTERVVNEGTLADSTEKNGNVLDNTSDLAWESDSKSSEEQAENEENHDMFSFADQDEYSEDGIEEDEDEPQGEEIPLEERNPEVMKQRAMFPFLDTEDESETSPHDTENSTEEYTEDSTEDDEPPFDVAYEPEEPEAPLAGLVAVGEPTAKKKEKKKSDYTSFRFPPIELLGKDETVQGEDVSAEIQENADKLIETLASFNVTASIKGVDRGPRITRYEVVPAKGVKVSNVMNLQDNIALELAANEIRMEAPIPGKSAIGIEIPNKKSTTVRLRDLLETPDFIGFKSKTSVCIGRDVAGQPVFGDLATMPHLLIAGATGMGKSVCINALMISILYKARPDEVKFIMIDPKQVEFTMYNGIPHLLVPVVSDAKKAAGVLMWAVEEMEKRYAQLNSLYVRNVDAYNEKIANDPSLGETLSRIVIVIDEFADLMLQVRDPVENLVMRIAQKARAAGIHLIIGTQRPTANVITGTIKANIPSRISCKVASNVDSRTVLDASGAEKLLNKGDMLYAFAGAIKPLRVQGAFVSDGEVEAIMRHLQSMSDGDSYDSAVMEEIERAAQKCSKKSDSSRDTDDESNGEGYLNDQQFLDAVELAVNTGRIATSLIQRKLSIGYGKAAKFIDIMEDMGIVGEQNGQRPREVKITPDEWREKLARASLD